MRRSEYIPAIALLCFIALFVMIHRSVPQTHTLTIAPQSALQGDPVMITIQTGLAIRGLTFDGHDIPVFAYDREQRALIAIPFNERPGPYGVTVTFADGSQATDTVSIAERSRPAESLGIPATLGGNTLASENQLLVNLAQENRTLSAIPTAPEPLWTMPFRGPLATLIVTDPYGYDRVTGTYTIIHKGTDFYAPQGTPVFAMNRGIVRIAQVFTVYGGTVIIDHGLGLQTFYMHLSKILVTPGQPVSPGQMIGLSGETGYAEGPHLHLTVRIDGISIDPLTFFSFFGIKTKVSTTSLQTDAD